MKKTNAFVQEMLEKKLQIRLLARKPSDAIEAMAYQNFSWKLS